MEILNSMPSNLPEYAQIDYRQKGLMRKRSHGWTGSNFAAAPSLQPTVAWPGKPRQHGIDALVGQPRLRPAVDQAVCQPDHQKRHQAGGRDVGEEMPAECHPERAGRYPEQGGGGKS